MKIKLPFFCSLSFLALCSYSNTYTMEMKNEHRLNSSNINKNYVVDRLLSRNLSVTEIISKAHEHLEKNLPGKENTKTAEHFFFIVRMLATISAKNPGTLVPQYFGKNINGTFSDEFYNIKQEDLPSDGAKLGYSFTRMVLNLKTSNSAASFGADNAALIQDHYTEWFGGLIKECKLFVFLTSLGAAGKKTQNRQPSNTSTTQGNTSGIPTPQPQTSTNDNQQYGTPLVNFQTARDKVKNSILKDKSHIINVHFDLKKMTKNQPAQQKEDKAAEDILFKAFVSNKDVENILFEAFGSNLVAATYYWNKIPEMIVASKYPDYYKSKQLEELIGIAVKNNTNNLYEDLLNLDIGENLFSTVNYFVLLCIINNKLQIDGRTKTNEPEEFIRNHHKFIKIKDLEQRSSNDSQKSSSNDSQTIIDLASFIIKNFQAKELLGCFKNRKNYKKEAPNENKVEIKYPDKKPTVKNFENTVKANVKKALLAIYYNPDLRQKISALAEKEETKDKRYKAIEDVFSKLDKNESNITLPDSIKEQGEISRILTNLQLDEYATILEIKNKIEDLYTYVNDKFYKDIILIKFCDDTRGGINDPSKIKDQFEAISIVSGPNVYILDKEGIKKSQAGGEFKKFPEETQPGKQQTKINNEIQNIQYILLTRKKGEENNAGTKYVAETYDLCEIIENIKNFATDRKQEDEINEHINEQTENFNLQSIVDSIGYTTDLDKWIKQKHKGLKWLGRYLQKKGYLREGEIAEKLDKLTNKLFNILEKVDDIVGENNQTHEKAIEKTKEVIGKYGEDVVLDSLRLAVNIENVISSNKKSMYYLLQGFRYNDLSEIGKKEKALREHLKTPNLKLESSKTSTDRKGARIDKGASGRPQWIDELQKNSRFKQNNTRQNTQASDRQQTQQRTKQSEDFKRTAQFIQEKLTNNNPGGNGATNTKNQPKGSVVGNGTRPKNPQPQTTSGGNMPPPPPPLKIDQINLQKPEKTASGANSQRSSGKGQNEQTRPEEETNLLDGVQLNHVETEQNGTKQNNTEVEQLLRKHLAMRRQDIGGNESSSDDATEETTEEEWSD